MPPPALWRDETTGRTAISPNLRPMSTNTIHFDNASEAREVGAALETLLPRMEADYGLSLLIRDLAVAIEGPEEPAGKIARFIEALREARNRSALDDIAIGYAYDAFSQGDEQVFEKLK